ncbi:unnamed protein product, partial [marine sediment metagenome]
HNSLNCRFLGFELDFFNEDHDGAWCTVVVDPPDTVNPLVHYEKFYDNPNVITLCRWDSGFRWVDALRVEPKNPSVVRCRLIGNSKKYSHLREMYGDVE